MSRILVIDDDPAVLSLLSALLESAGHFAVLATDGRNGMKQFASASFDLVITDIVMPEQEGIATIVAMRRTSLTLPILAISGSSTVGGDGDYLRVAEALGATASLSKPIMPDSLIDTVNRLLSE